jgi:hypothetical protein
LFNVLGTLPLIAKLWVHFLTTIEKSGTCSKAVSKIVFLFFIHLI